jgi:hypothetical protein
MVFVGVDTRKQEHVAWTRGVSLLPFGKPHVPAVSLTTSILVSLFVAFDWLVGLKANRFITLKMPRLELVVILIHLCERDSNRFWLARISSFWSFQRCSLKLTIAGPGRMHFRRSFDLSVTLFRIFLLHYTYNFINHDMNNLFAYHVWPRLQEPVALIQRCSEKILW